jgi:predicted MFS family arabinose efflux permease
MEHRATLRSGEIPFASTPEVAAGMRKKGPLASVLDVLARDAAFRRFEVGFLLYGCGFMALQPVLAQWIVTEIGAGYSTASAAKGLTFYAALVPATALAGHLFDRIGVARLAGGAMVLLAVFALWASTIREAWLLFPAFALFGFAMAGINVTWTIGPIRFAGGHSAALYMAVHVALVGVRALIGNPLGGLLYQTTGGSSWTFRFAACCFLAGAMVMATLRGPGPPLSGATT